MLAGMKIAREIYRHKEDNLVDLAGYSACVQMIYDKKEELQIQQAERDDYDRNFKPAVYEETTIG